MCWVFDLGKGHEVWAFGCGLVEGGSPVLRFDVLQGVFDAKCVVDFFLALIYCEVDSIVVGAACDIGVDSPVLEGVRHGGWAIDKGEVDY